MIARKRAFITPSNMDATLIPDATPQILNHFDAVWSEEEDDPKQRRRVDEQSILARLLYGKLIDIFLGVSAYRFQSHLRTTVQHFGGAQIEIDEVYVATEKSGAHFIIPVQAKGESPKERISCIQLIQDWFWCKERFPYAVPRVLAAKLLRRRVVKGYGNVIDIALVEASVSRNYNVSIKRQQVFSLVPAASIGPAILKGYRTNFTRRGTP
jgi:hypothetical protein